MRRRILQAIGLGMLTQAASSQETATDTKATGRPPVAPSEGSQFAVVEAGQPLVFPKDHGAHPAFRTEWWYITGWLAPEPQRWIGFQLTFFRSRLPYQSANPSAWAPRQLLLAHMALADPLNDKLQHAQRAWRQLPGIAQFSTTDTALQVQDWRLTRQQEPNGERYRSVVQTPEFAWDLQLATTMPPWKQGRAGFSAKGLIPRQASFYYSRPQLQVSGTLSTGSGRGKQSASGKQPVKGVAWLDHEWSSTLLDTQAVGWDWVGLNLLDGRSLMAFRIRRADGSVLYSYANTPEGSLELRWTVNKVWRSPRTAAQYPVGWQLRSDRAGLSEIDIVPLMLDQELDARFSTGLVYWEGAVEARQGERVIGRGYLELTGYHEAVRL